MNCAPSRPQKYAYQLYQSSNTHQEQLSVNSIMQFVLSDGYEDVDLMKYVPSVKMIISVLCFLNENIAQTAD